MGFSLRNIGRKIEDVLGGVERQINPFDGGATYSNPNPAPQQQRPNQTIQNGVVVNTPQGRGQVPTQRNIWGAGNQSQPNIWGSSNDNGDSRDFWSKLAAQANPLDNGRTWKNPTPTNNQSVVQQAQNSGAAHVIAPGVDLVKGLADTAYKGAQAPVDLGIALGNHINGNQLEQDKAMDMFKQNVKPVVDLARSVPRAAYQLGESVNPAGGDVYDRSHTFQNPVAKTVFGEDPINSMQKQFKETEATRGKGTAVGEAALTALMDAATLKAGGMKAKPAVKAAARGAAKVAADEGGFIAGSLAPKPKGVPEFVDAATGRKLWEGDDSKVRFQPNYKPAEHAAAGEQKLGLPLGQVIDHPKLFQAYPSLKDMPVHMDSSLPDTTFGSYNGSYLRLNPKHLGDKEEMMRTILHETQHAIQHKERLPGGGDSSVAKMGRDEIGEQINDFRTHPEVTDFLNRSRGMIREGKEMGMPKSELNRSLKALEKTGTPAVQQFLGLVQKSSKLKNLGPMELYGRLHGEAYARGVERRMEMTPQERAAKPFVGSIDVPVDELITEHGAGKERLDKQIQDMQNNFEYDDAFKQNVTGPHTGDYGAPEPKPRVATKQKPTVKLTPDEIKAGKALGMTVREMKAAKTDTGLDTAFSSAFENYAPEELAALKPGDQMAIDKILHRHTELNTPEHNLARNPKEPSITTVKQGDYEAARHVPGAVAAPIKFVRDRWTTAMKDLKKNSPEEFRNFWRNVETGGDGGSPLLQKAIALWREGADRIHANSVAVGKNTNYLNDWALHPWLLKDADENMVATQGTGALLPHTLARRHLTIAEGEEEAGLTLGDNPLEEGTKYFNGAANALHREATVKALTEADAGEMVKPHTLDLGYGKTVPLSDKGMDGAKGLAPLKLSRKKAVVGLRTVNQGLKSTTLSLSQFHTMNIVFARAAPAIAIPKFERLAHGDLTMGAHPVAAAKGAYGAVRAALPGGTKFVDKVLTKAASEGVIDPGTGKPISYMDAAAKIGAPYGESGYNTSGSLLKEGVGHKLVFGKQLPMMHDQVMRSVLADLVQNKVPLDSHAAREAGAAANSTMGFINKEAINMSPRVRQAMSDFMLAGQFTPSKVMTLSKVAKKGVAGQYARADVISNALAATAVIVGVGYLVNQKSDNIKDMLLRALVDPAVPTPYKDKKGNTQSIRTPMTYTSEVSHLMGIKLVRNGDGHLGVSWNPKNLPGTLSEWARARLSPLGSDAVKVATNTDFANKPLYDPEAPFGQKVEQAATTILGGHLPIGAQGLPYTKMVKDHAPGGVKEVLDANTPNGNPLIHGVGSSFGLTPRTDQTVGKANETSHYFGELEKAKAGLNSHERDALDLYAGSKKNPVTGKYEVMPNANDSQTKARVLLDQPKVIDRLISMNKALAKQGQKVDPLWTQPTDKVKAVLSYQAMPPGGPDKSHWIAKNKDWYSPLSDQRGAFFDSLPKGDPNKPAAPVEFPSPSDDVAKQQDEYFGISDSGEAAKYLADHPAIQQQLDKQAEYNNKMREATGYSALDTYPKAEQGVQKIIETYNALPKKDGPKGGNKTRSLWIQSHPNEYKAMTDYFTKASMYGLEREAAQAEFADTDMSQKGLKEAYNLGKYDIQKNGNTYTLGGSDGSDSSGSSSSYHKYHSYSSAKDNENYDPFAYNNSFGTSGQVAAKAKLKPQKRAAVAYKGAPSTAKKKATAINKAKAKPKVRVKKLKV